MLIFLVSVTWNFWIYTGKRALFPIGLFITRKKSLISWSSSLITLIFIILYWQNLAADTRYSGNVCTIIIGIFIFGLQFQPFSSTRTSANSKSSIELPAFWEQGSWEPEKEYMGSGLHWMKNFILKLRKRILDYPTVVFLSKDNNISDNLLNQGKE